MSLTRGRLAGLVAAVTGQRGADDAAHLQTVSRDARRALESGRLQDAEQGCMYVLVRDDSQPEALRCLAEIVSRREEWQKAVHCAVLLERAGHLDLADEAFDLAHDAAPGERDPLVRRGLLAQRRGRGELALDCFRRALALDPILAVAQVQSGLIHLSMGSFRLGWQEFDWRLRLPQYESLHRVSRPLWRGESLEQGGLLIQPEARADDTAAFRVYLTLLAEQGAQVILSVPSEAKSAFEGMPGIARTIAPADENEPAVLQAVRWRCPIGSLPLWLGPAADSIPLGLSAERLSSEW